MEQRKLLTVHIAARRLCVSRHTIYRLIYICELEAVNVAVGKKRAKWRVFESSVIELTIRKSNMNEV